MNFMSIWPEGKYFPALYYDDMPEGAFWILRHNGVR
jgi:hypothetical protein